MSSTKPFTTIAHATKIDSLQIEVHRLHSTVDSLHKSLNDFGIASTYFHDILNTDITTFVGLVGAIVTIIALVSWGTFILPLRREINRLNRQIININSSLSTAENSMNLLTTRITNLDEQKIQMDEKIDSQQKTIDFIASTITVGKVSIKLTSSTGEDAHAAGAVIGEGLSQPIGLPNDITLPFGNYTVQIIRYGYEMNPNVLPFQVNKMFTTVDIPVVKSPPTGPPAAEAAPVEV